MEKQNFKNLKSFIPDGLVTNPWVQKLGLWSVRHRDSIIKIGLPMLIIAMGYFSCTFSQRNIQQNIHDVFAISDDVRAFYADKPDYWGLNSEFVIKNKLLPSNFIKNQQIVLGRSTPILIGSGEHAETVMPMGQTFDIVLPNLTKAQCISYAEAPLNEQQYLKLNSISILNIKGTYAFEWGGQRALPIAKYATKDLCIDGKNTVIWSIK